MIRRQAEEKVKNLARQFKAVAVMGPRQSGNLYYWRDNVGHEIDVVIDNGIEIIPVEAKSGSTITGDFFKGLAYWAELANTPKGLVFYGGDESQERSTGFKVEPWRKLGAY